MAEELVGANVADTDEAVTTDHVEELETAEPKGGDDSDPQTDANDGEPKHKPKGGWQRKIERLEREVQTLRAKPAPVVETPKAEPFTYDKAEPDPKEFDLGDGTYDVAKYTKAMIQYERDKAKAEDAHEQKHKETLKQTEEQKNKQAEVIKSWREKNAEAIKKYDDFQDALGAAQVEPSPLMHEAILNSDYGADLAYYFATNEEEALKISQMNAYQAGKAIDKIEAKFAPQDSAEKEQDEEPADPPPSRAPKPATPVGKPSAAKAPSIYDDNLPFKDFVKLREAQIQRKK